ncbi:N-6 DNA methylase [Mesorhizobium sp.]|uniref:N-6 DNA methylase n=1 Tax=Mesorhizobium sp. TaxID=1871066 RepID=UPI0025CC9B73|nr:N-6 DNA methylase [Mesorhizobium sp.]
MARTKKKNGAEAAPMTTSQMLGSLLKSARDIMRKDKGLNGDLDRLPLLTWIMFLKFLDDLEQQREQETALSGKKFKVAIEAPYRWRDWAADPQGITGDELLSFINSDEAVRADGKKGPGLFAYLRSLTSSNGDNRRDVIATVFKGVDNRMKSGYLLRDIINKVGGIHFTSSDELHTLGALYESMLREMRDAAGDSGEFYTPRAVVRFMVEVTDPRLGETVLDPASGTGGFLVEAYNYLEQQVKTVADRRRLQNDTLTGCEPKSLPYLLCQMNLLLHGLDAPQIDPGNALRFKLSEIGENERVDVIVTNPPFGGEEEKGIQGNFPEDRQTSETALLFLQLIMRKLKRQPTSAGRPARAAVVVPNGTLYEAGVARRLREDLLRDFNLHTIVRLPKGVFEPYTDIATNILFFDRGERLPRVWFYEHPLPEHRAHLKGKTYSATDGIVFEEFNALIDWWNDRRDTESAWSIDKDELEANECDFAQIHPRHNSIAFRSPSLVVGEVKSLMDSSTEIIKNIESELASLTQLDAPLIPLRDVLSLRKASVKIEDQVTYTRPTVQMHFRGAKIRDRELGSKIGTKNQFLMKANDLIMSRIDARHGAMAIVPSILEGAIATNDFPVFEIDTDRAEPEYLRFALFQPEMLRIYETLSRGSTNRRRIIVDEFLKLKVPIPESVEEQEVFSSLLRTAEDRVFELSEHLGGIVDEVQSLISSSLFHVFSRS